MRAENWEWSSDPTGSQGPGTTSAEWLKEILTKDYSSKLLCQQKPPDISGNQLAAGVEKQGGESHKLNPNLILVKK